MALIIGLCGKAGSGKGEVSKILQKHFKTCVIPFAKPLKQLAKQFGWDGNKDEKGRKFLQMLGTEIGRAYNPNYWVDRWIEETTTALAETETGFGLGRFEKIYDIIVADDCRFDNEAECIRKMDGYIIQIIGRAYNLGNNSNHASERGISPEFITHTIDNSTTLEDLEGDILRLINFIKEKENDTH